MYYNCTHPIKIPAPAKLAHRYSNYVGDKYDPRDPNSFITGKGDINKYNSLWFLWFYFFIFIDISIYKYIIIILRI